MKDLYLPKWLIVLSAIEDNTYVMQIHRKIGSTPGTFYKLIGQLEEAGLIRSNKVGRKRMLTLTAEGKKVKEVMRR